VTAAAPAVLPGRHRRPTRPDADPLEWERPILYAQVDLGGGRVLHVINLHLKSKIATTITGQKKDNFTWKTPSAWAEGSFISSMKRVGQALQVRLEIDRLFDQDGQTGDPTPLIAICGDFNAKKRRGLPASDLRTGGGHRQPRPWPTGHGGLRDQVAESARYSLFHLGQGEMIDHVLASRALLATLDHTEIHNEYLSDESGAFRTDVKFPESDHAPVVAQFTLV
jgi:predicted extracellular nuclease